MNIENVGLNTIIKDNKDSKSITTLISKNNIKRNLKLMNDPAFHFNKTLKEYIENKLNNNFSTEKMSVLKDNKSINEIKMKNGIINIIPKLNERYKYFNRIKTITNILNQNKSKKISKNRKIKIKNVNSKSSQKIVDNKNKLNLTLFNFHNKTNSLKFKENLNQKLNTFSNNSSTPKYFHKSGSNLIDSNNHFLEKNNNYSNSNINQYILNNINSEVNSLKTPLTQNNKKKNNFVKNNNNLDKILPNERYYITNEINNNLISLDNNEYNNTCYNDNIMKKSFKYNKNNSVIIINANINNRSDNSIKNSNKKNYIENIINKDCDIQLKTDSNEYYNIIKDGDNQNKIDNFNKNDNNNNIEYLKKIEMLENENKLLKGEISKSKNRLIILEKKIGLLLSEKNITEKGECPQPMPYVKKYSAQTCINFRPAKSPINDSSNRKEAFVKNIKGKVEKNKNRIKNINNKLNKKNLNKNKKYIISNKYLTLKTSINLSPFKNKIYLKNNKSICCLRTRNNSDIYLKVNLSNKSHKNIFHNKRVNKKSKKNFNKNLFFENDYSQSKSPNKRDFISNDIKK